MFSFGLLVVLLFILVPLFCCLFSSFVCLLLVFCFAVVFVNLLLSCWVFVCACFAVLRGVLIVLYILVY